MNYVQTDSDFDESENEKESFLDEIRELAENKPGAGLLNLSQVDRLVRDRIRQRASCGTRFDILWRHLKSNEIKMENETIIDDIAAALANEGFSVTTEEGYHIIKW